MPRSLGDPILLTPEVLRRWPLPRIDSDADKDGRGRVLVVGGSRGTPGAVMLAGLAALRVGAGKLQIATVNSTAIALGVAVPEALVVGLPESDDGHIAPSAADRILECAAKADAVCLGPGLFSSTATTALAAALVRGLDASGPALVLDAAALDLLRAQPGALHGLACRVVLTPHGGEMAHLLGIDRHLVTKDAHAISERTAADLRAVVALKGSDTFIGAPEDPTTLYVSGDAGLATSGSGDVLAGLVAGLLARGALAPHAAAWAVCLHGDAGNVLSHRMGRVGFLARELLDEVPMLLRALCNEPP